MQNAIVIKIGSNAYEIWLRAEFVDVDGGISFHDYYDRQAAIFRYKAAAVKYAEEFGEDDE